MNNNKLIIIINNKLLRTMYQHFETLESGLYASIRGSEILAKKLGRQ